MGVTVLPQWAHPKPTPDEVAVYTGFVAGYQYSEGAQFEAKIQPGDPLALVREPENENDPKAISLHWHGHRIGYIPRRHNLVLTNMLDRNVPLSAEIKGIDGEGVSWERVVVEVGMVL